MAFYILMNEKLKSTICVFGLFANLDLVSVVWVKTRSFSQVVSCLCIQSCIGTDVTKLVETIINLSACNNLMVWHCFGLIVRSTCRFLHNGRVNLHYFICHNILTPFGLCCYSFLVTLTFSSGYTDTC